MRKIALVLLALLFLASYGCALETYYLRTDGGSACSLGDKESLNATDGSTDVEKQLGGGDSWNKTETARTIGAGTWTVYLDLRHDNTGGNVVKRQTRALVRRMDSGCVEQDIILDVNQAPGKGEIAEFTFEQSGVGQIIYSANDILLLEVFNWTGEVLVRYDNAAGGGYDSRLVHPDESTNTAPAIDVNAIAGNPDNQVLPVFSYVRDGNLTIDFNVFDAENDSLTLDINYSPNNTRGTGNVLIKGLSLDSTVCSSTQFDSGLGVECSYDLNITPDLVTDWNYFILALISDGSETDFNASDYNFMVDNNVPNTVADYNLVWQSADANVTFTCSDLNSGCSVTRFRKDTDPSNGISFGSVIFGNADDLNALFDQEGKWTLDFNSTDFAGNTEDSNIIQILIDKTGPTTIDNDFNNTWQNSDANIQFSCTDLLSGCQNFYYQLNDVNYRKKWGVGDQNIGIELDWDGNHKIIYWSDDNTITTEDNNGPVKLIYLGIDKSVPVSKDNDFNNQWQSSDANIQISCSDASPGDQNAGCKNLYYAVDDVNYQARLGFGDQNIGIVLDWDGNHKVWYWSDDNTTGMGDSNETGHMTYLAIDKTGPTTIDNDFNTGWSNSDQNIQLSCADSSLGDQNAGCRNLYYAVDDVNYQVAWGVGDQNIGIVLDWDANHKIIYWSDDNITGYGSDNNGAVKLIYLGVDKSVPVSKDNDFNNQWQSSDANIQISCNDTSPGDQNAGCKNLYYAIDDVNYQARWGFGDQNIGIVLDWDGNHEVWYWSDDNTTGMGDSNETGHMTYLAIDKTGPTTIDNDFNTGWSNSDQNIQLSCADSSLGDQNAGCRNLYYAVDDVNYQVAWGVGDQNIGIVLDWDSNHKIIYWSDDNITGYGSDNNGAVKLIYLAVDKTVPTTIDNDFNNQWQSSDANIQISCNDTLPDN